MFRQIILAGLFVVPISAVLAANPTGQAGGYAAPGYIAPGYPAGTYIAPGRTVAPGVYNNPYYSPYVSPYQGTYRTPYGSTPVYSAPYVYSSPYGYSNLSGSVPTPIGGNQFGITYGNGSLRLWRAPSGYYYPWVGGYNYNAYPIFVTPPGAASSTATSPPISTVVSDLGQYLDSAKKDGKIADGDFLSLKRRGSDLLSKEKSLAYEAGGSLDADQEAEIRRDVDELSGEVARHVRP
jgi:hypothetical protein